MAVSLMQLESIDDAFRTLSNPRSPDWARRSS
jgi:hypothetical protein